MAPKTMLDLTLIHYWCSLYLNYINYQPCFDSCVGLMAFCPKLDFVKLIKLKHLLLRKCKRAEITDVGGKDLAHYVIVQQPTMAVTSSIAHAFIHYSTMSTSDLEPDLKSDHLH